MKTRLSIALSLAFVSALGPLTCWAGETTNSVPVPTQSQPKVVASTVKPYESPWYTQISKLAQVGIEDRVMLAFVDSAGTFNLTPNQLVHLRELGVSSEVITAILQHDAEVALGVRQVAASVPPPGSFAFPKSFTAAPLTSSNGNRPKTQVPAPLDNGVTAAAVVTPPEPTLASEMPSQDFAQDAYQPVVSTPEPACVTPVRKPYAEQLTDPIIVVRAAGRTPNLMVLEMFP